MTDKDMKTDNNRKDCKGKNVNLRPWRRAVLATLILMSIVALMMIPSAAGAPVAWAVGLLVSKAAAASGLWVAWRLAQGWGMLPARA